MLEGKNNWWSWVFSSVQLFSGVWLLATPWTAECQVSLSVTDSRMLFKLMPMESVMPFNHLILSIPFSSWLQSFPASGSYPISQFFSSGGQGWSFSLSISPSDAYKDWFPWGLTALNSLQCKGLSKSLLQHDSLKALIIWHSVFFIIQLSHSCMSTGKIIALTRQTFVSKITSLLFNMLTSFKAFLPNFLHRKLTKLITWITALSNSVKLWAMLGRATKDGGVMVESSNQMWSTGKGNGKPLQYSCHENPMNRTRRQNRPSVKFSSVAQSRPILCNPMDCSTPDFLDHYKLLELAQTHVHQVGNAI